MSARSKTVLVLAVLATPICINGAQAATYTWKNTGIDFNAATGDVSTTSATFRIGTSPNRLA